MDFCVHCASPNDHGGRFCFSCGRQLVRNGDNRQARTNSSDVGVDLPAPRPTVGVKEQPEPKEMPSIPSGARIVLRQSKLPRVTKERIRHALAEGASNAIALPGHSTQGVKLCATIAAIVAILAIIGVFAYTQQYRWNVNERAATLIVLAVALVVVGICLPRLIRIGHSHFRDAIIINPFYVICLKFSELIAYPLSSLKSPDLNDEKSYLPSVTALTLTFEDGSVICTSNTPLERMQLMNALRGFKSFREELTVNDVESLQNLDLLFEARPATRQYGKAHPLRLFDRFGRVAVIVALLATAAAWKLADRMNDSSDDKLRWSSAIATNTAAAFRLYLASRPTGEHRTNAEDQIGQIYRQSGERYAEQAGRSSAAVESVLAVLEYARTSGHYKIAVTFAGANQIPDRIEEQLKSEYGIANIRAASWSFQDKFNKGRESMILQRIQTSFQKVIPGDVLEFEADTPEAGEAQFEVGYVVKPTGSLYYPDREKDLSDAKRNYYVGVGYDWRFCIRVPGRQPLYVFKFASSPASLFKVAYQRASKRGSFFNGDMTNSASDMANPAEVYDAMAESAFEDFSSKLLSEVALRREAEEMLSPKAPNPLSASVH
jgi:hypothetical protein